MTEKRFYQAGLGGLSVFSSKKTLYKENYVISYVSDLIDEDTKRKYDLITRIDYKRLVDSAAVDIIIFDAANGAHLYGMEDAIGLNYKTEFEFKHITVYTRK